MWTLIYKDNLTLGNSLVKATWLCSLSALYFLQRRTSTLYVYSSEMHGTCLETWRASLFSLSQITSKDIQVGIFDWLWDTVRVTNSLISFKFYTGLLMIEGWKQSAIDLWNHCQGAIMPPNNCFIHFLWVLIKKFCKICMKPSWQYSEIYHWKMK